MLIFFFLKNGKRALDRSRTSSSWRDESKGFNFKPKKQFIGGKLLNRRKEYYLRTYGTGSLVPAVFRRAVFTCAHFQKIPKIFGSCGFSLQQ